MLTQIRQFIWPSREEIANFDKLKWYQGLNFWYFMVVIVSLMILQAIYGIHKEIIDYSEICDVLFVVFLLICAPLGSIFFLYLMYRRYTWAYFGMGLSYYVFDYAIKGKLYQVEQAYYFIPVYILGVLVFRINWYYRQLYPTNKLQLKKDCIIALFLMEVCFYVSDILFGVRIDIMFGR